MQKILIVEDEPDVADLISFNLARAGYKTVIAHDGIAGIELALATNPDIVLLDLMLPGKDGYAVTEDLGRDHRTTATPVIMLTARSDLEDRIHGLEARSPDYLAKPFSLKELLLRVRTVLRRSGLNPGAVEFEFGPFRFDKNYQKFYLDNEPVELTSTALKLLRRLTERAGSTQRRHDLLRSVWGYGDENHSRTLDTRLNRLR